MLLFLFCINFSFALLLFGTRGKATSWDDENSASKRGYVYNRDFRRYVLLFIYCTWVLYILLKTVFRSKAFLANKPRLEELAQLKKEEEILVKQTTVSLIPKTSIWSVGLERFSKQNSKEGLSENIVDLETKIESGKSGQRMKRGSVLTPKSKGGRDEGGSEKIHLTREHRTGSDADVAFDLTPGML